MVHLFVSYFPLPKIDSPFYFLQVIIKQFLQNHIEPKDPFFIEDRYHILQSVHIYICSKARSVHLQNNRIMMNEGSFIKSVYDQAVLTDSAPWVSNNSNAVDFSTSSQATRFLWRVSNIFSSPPFSSKVDGSMFILRC